MCWDILLDYFKILLLKSGWRMNASKELSLNHKLKFTSPYTLETLCCKPYIFVNLDYLI